MPKFDCHMMKRSLNGPENECGDTGFIHAGDESCFAALVDVLGHGPEAHEVALTADEYLAANFDAPLTDVITGLHEHLRGTRGCVASLCRLELATGEIQFSGVGNITCRIFGSSLQHLMSRDGIVGYMMSRPISQTLHLVPGDLIMLYSDGVREHFDVNDYPGLLTGTAGEIVERVMENLAKGDDDASCLVVRYAA